MRRRKIVLGVTGSIAAHKAADLASLVESKMRRARGDDGRRAAFHHAAAVQDLSRNPVVTNLYDEEEGWKPTHIQSRGRSGFAADRARHGECDRENGASVLPMTR